MPNSSFTSTKWNIKFCILSRELSLLRKFIALRSITFTSGLQISRKGLIARIVKNGTLVAGVAALWNGAAVACSRRGWSCTPSLRAGKERTRGEYVLCIRCTSFVYCYTTPNGQARNWWQLRGWKGTRRGWIICLRSFPPCGPTSLSFLGPMTRRVPELTAISPEDGPKAWFGPDDQSGPAIIRQLCETFPARRRVSDYFFVVYLIIDEVCPLVLCKFSSPTEPLDSFIRIHWNFPARNFVNSLWNFYKLLDEVKIVCSSYFDFGTAGNMWMYSWWN